MPPSIDAAPTATSNAEDWTEYPVVNFRIRRGAMLALIEQDIDNVLHRNYRGARSTLTSVSRHELDRLRKIRLLRLQWTLDGTSADYVMEAFVIAGPTVVARISGDLRTAPEAPEHFLDRSLREQGGDDIRKLLQASQVDTEKLVDRLVALISPLAKPKNMVCLGVDVPWPNSTGTPLSTKIRYITDIEKEEEHWKPVDLRDHPAYEDRKELFGRLIEASVPAETASTDAKLAFEQEERENPWTVLLNSDHSGPEAESFSRRAEMDLPGFAGPRAGDAVTIQARKLPFYDQTKVCDLMDWRSGYPRRSRFIAKYEMREHEIVYTHVEPVTWKSRNIYIQNQREKIKLSPEQVRPYLKYFCQHTSSSNGYFKLVEHPDELIWLGLNLRPRQESANFIRPIELWTPEPVLPEGSEGMVGAFLTSGAVIYARTLFRACFIVLESGLVEMVQDNPVGLRIPIVPEIVSEKTHFVHLAREEYDR